MSFEQVGVDETYSFRLPPGLYYVEATFAPPASVNPWRKASIVAGHTTYADIPNPCN